ncbi:aminotransferase class I/II-fold pyridoxal phosphate-dependent enzyme [Filobacillus milosensis]|uniref:Aminotransferase class I/II-fold pyridoxal phosphate-dependent enzyme n=1 Tax=Filobacillus milosensis TaxID=94137 RepID=A0A4Y8IL93_9BACI|nr:aminotransferase class I/II-fold pyridoxal phosphate-dependent enzyme [Filobacillus milosensis]TFB14659.1 aminotransferase class I/II-fold pyridoxal phosphate-dependent enzyme [Filobacillus milosensis]
MSSEFLSIGEVLSHIKDVNNLEERAKTVQKFVDKDNEYGRYLESGSATLMNVVSEDSGENRECILWNVNHYLSLNRNIDVIEKACQALRQFGTGCGTSASSCGMTSLHKQIEHKISEMVGKEDAVLFPTGYTTNLGAISYLVGNKDLIIFDRESHSSIINGIKLSNAKRWMSFKHNDLSDLSRKLQKFENTFENIFVIVESAYSMSGDLAPLKELTKLKDSHNFYLYVDEAHTFGIYGEKGQGYCYEEGVTDNVDFIMSTLSKATASVGGFLAANKEYCSLIRYSDPYLFQACLTPADAAVVLASLEEIEKDPSLITKLHANNYYMRHLLTAKGFNLGNSASPIIPIFIEDHQKLRMVVKDLYLQGIYSTPIVFPAVKMNQGRIRLIVNYAHTKEQIEYTVNTLEDICQKHQVIDNEFSVPI